MTQFNVLSSERSIRSLQLFSHLKPQISKSQQQTHTDTTQEIPQESGKATLPNEAVEKQQEQQQQQQQRQKQQPMTLVHELISLSASNP